MPRELSIVLVGEDRDVGKVLEEVRKVKLVPVQAQVVRLSNLKDTLQRLHPHLVVYDTDGNPAQIKSVAQAFSHEFPATRWAVVSKETNIDMALEFFRMGATDFIKEPVQSEDIKRLLQRVMTLETAKEAEGGKDDHRLMMGVFSTKGGVGLTTVSSNLAVELAARNVGNVLLLDLVLQHGNVGDFLDIPSHYTLLDIMENFERLDSNLLEKSVTKHESGLFVLPCPKQPEDEEYIVANQTSEIFQFLRGVFRYVIADLGHEFSKLAISYLDLADEIILVATPDVPSLVNARNALQTFNRLGYAKEKIKVVLNRWGMRGQVDLDAIQKHLGVDLFCTVPDDSASCLAAVNQGIPLVRLAKKSDVAKGFQKMSSMVLVPPVKGK
ncbi:MAG: AAA family ATPase [Candidatus Omnitrophica bacterium]|nr:AAA family ATPase [Candidatus Omnitrophota bacterium]